MKIQRTYSPTALTVWRLLVPSMERDGAVIVSSRRKRKRRASVLVCGLNNHGLSRTAFVRFAARRDASPHRETASMERGMSVLVGGLLQRFQRVGIEEKVEKADVTDAVIVAVGGRVLPVDNHLLETVACVLEGERLLRHLFLVWYHPGRLDVDAFVAAIHHEVDFMGGALEYTVLPGESLDFPDIDIVAKAYKFVENCILHEMRHFDLPVVEMDVAKTKIGGIIFAWGVEISFALDVVPPRLLDEKRILEVSKITCHGRPVCPYAHDGLDRVGKFFGIGESADAAHHNVGKSTEDFRIFDVIPVDDIFEIDGSVNVLEILPFLAFSFHEYAFRKPSKGEVFDKGGVAVRGVHGWQGFGKGERCNRYYLASASKLGGYILGKHFCVGACHICYHIVGVEKSVKHIVEGYIHVSAVVRMYQREVSAFWKSLGHVLDFIDKHVHWLAVHGDEFLQVFPESDRIAKMSVLIFFKIKRYDVVPLDPGIAKMVSEKIEEQVAFPASTDSGDEFDQMVAFRPDKAVEKVFAFYVHTMACVFDARVMIQKLKTPKLYQISIGNARGVFKNVSLNFCAGARKFKARKAA